jgi:hypothetical protein
MSKFISASISTSGTRRLSGMVFFAFVQSFFKQDSFQVLSSFLHVHVTSNCSRCSEHASSALYTSFTDRAEAAYLSTFFVKPRWDGNRFLLVEKLQYLSHLCASSLDKQQMCIVLVLDFLLFELPWLFVCLNLFDLSCIALFLKQLLGLFKIKFSQ